MPCAPSNLTMTDYYIQQRDDTVEKDNALVEKDNALVEKDNALVEKDKDSEILILQKIMKY